MMRITIQDDQASVTFRLEGTLTGPWVHEASECWQSVRANHPGRPVRVDLAGVTSIDAAGKQFLTSMHAERAELIAYGCMMRAIVGQIRGVPILEGTDLSDHGNRVRRDRRPSSEPGSSTEPLPY
jgi:hypothetical protein